MTKKQEIRYHIIFWIVFMSMDQLFNAIMYQKSSPLLWSVLETAAFTAIHMLVFYLNYLWIGPNTIPQKKWGWFALGQVGLLLLFPAVRYVAEEVVIYHITGGHNYDDGGRTFVYYVYDNSYFAFRIMLLSLVFYFIKFMWNANVQLNTLQMEKKQAELQGLKNQLSPHFLFNTLNSFYADLYDTQPKVADDILKLSEMLRYVTYENEHDAVLLKDEIEFLQHYIDLFKRRFDDGIFVVFSYPDSIVSQQVPSLLLIHFVENAFKHGVLGDKSYPLKIDLSIEDNRLLFIVMNRFERSEHYDAQGIGHKNIRQRLKLMYPDNHTLQITEQPNTYHITLNIPLL